MVSMTCTSKRRIKRFQERAAVAAWTMISMSVLLGFGALAVDLGHVRVVNSELQNAADAAAMAGASALLNPAELTGGLTQADLARFAVTRACAYADKNKVEQKNMYLDPADVTVGRITNIKNLDEPISPMPRYNAVRVVLRKNQESPNGQADLFFAKMWGKSGTDLAVTATAYLDGKMVAYKPKPGKNINPAIPVTVKHIHWVNQILNAQGSDSYGYDPTTGQITLGPDGIPELSIFPEKQKTETEDGAGNFGLLHIGNTNQGVTQVAEQIRYGLDETDVLGQFGDDEIRFVNDSGSAMTHIIKGTPGAKNSLVQLEDDLKSRVGTIIGFFTHVVVTESGANSTYTVNSMQFGRVMMVDGQGSVNGGKAVVIQPVSYLGEEVITGDNGPIHATGGRIQLIR